MCERCPDEKPSFGRRALANAAARGGRCHSEGAETANSRAVLAMECSKGHRWEALACNLARGSWCPHCAGNARGTMERCENAALLRGGHFLGDTVPSAHELAPWLCSKGHAWMASPGNIFAGYWCPACFGRKKWTPVPEAAALKAAAFAAAARALNAPTPTPTPTPTPPEPAPKPEPKRLPKRKLPDESAEDWDDPGLDQMIAAAKAAMAALEADAKLLKGAPKIPEREHLLGTVSMIDSVLGEGLISAESGRTIVFSKAAMSRPCWDEIEVGSKVKFRLDGAGDEAARVMLAQ